MMNSEKNSIEVSVVMPCLNEEAAVKICIDKCFKILEDNKINGEVIVVDNGSRDRSKEIIGKTKAIFVEESRKGYGSAYLKGFSLARGKYIVMGDSDNTYDFLDIPKFIEPLKKDCDFVIGSRLRGKIASGNGTMPWLHRYIGNPVLTFILQKLFDINVSDAHCGMRAISKEAYSKLYLQTTGMEFASEMIINAKRAGLKIKEIPIDYRLRLGESKLRTFKDGWRHLRFMLIYSPTFLFLLPGVFLLILGLLMLLALVSGPVYVSGIMFDYHYMFIGSIISIVGYQIINLGFFTKIYAYTEKFENEKNDRIVRFISDKISLEKMISAGLLIMLLGLLIFAHILYIWAKNNFGELFEIRKMIISITLLILGIQTIFYGFFYSILRIERK